MATKLAFSYHGAQYERDRDVLDSRFRERELGEFGIAVQSRAFRAGAVVPHAKANVGAIATQAMANLSYGPKG